MAAALADATLGAPVNGTIEIAGPERLPLDELARRYLSANQDPRQVVGDAQARYFGNGDRRSIPHLRRQPAPGLDPLR